ncbi:MAG: endonuclease/exonuclease/phosphatase family protein [Bacteroidales bacterium]|jgi:endonuclease/exonuclease/phosphatase family metal-dependent hydrolase|nr:endonuclease/exonuclease/phosphatase family protein [Bacteroidales bacterium]
MAKKKSALFHKGLIFVLLVLNVVAVLVLLFVYLSQYIPPTFSMLLTYCGLGFHYLVIVNLIFIVIWLFVKYQYALISIVFLLINVNNIDKTYQMRGTDKPEVCYNCIKVLSYNAQLFGVYNSNEPAEQIKSRNQILEMLQKENADIICLQEYFYEKSNKINFSTTDTILSMFNLNKRTNRATSQFYSCYFPINYKKEYFFGQAIFSKYRIINKGFVELPDTNTSNSAIYVDIRFKYDTIRVYSLHLESFRFDKIDYESSHLFLNNELNNPYLNEKAKLLSDRMEVAYKKRAGQAKAVRKHIEECQYPVIICGDFNDTPTSYSVNEVGSGFTDTYRLSGKGRGTTYHGKHFPSYRIDYIFHDKKFHSYGHTVNTSISVSDHYPIYSYISIKKR